jgi:Raf kinase inhibitor-like YbhB/YbcL family protein
MMFSKNVFAVGVTIAVATAVVVSAAATPSAALVLTSSAFAPGTPIPDAYTCAGDGTSPALTWTAPPKGTRSFALWVSDPDAPGGTWTHWLGWGMKANARGLAAGQKLPVTAPSGNGRREYQGMCAPAGAAHHYTFTLYALNVKTLKLAPLSAYDATFRKAIKGHVLARAKLVGLWQPSINAGTQTTTG